MGTYRDFAPGELLQLKEIVTSPLDAFRIDEAIGASQVWRDQYDVEWLRMGRTDYEAIDGVASRTKSFVLSRRTTGSRFWVMVEHHGSAATRSVVEEAGVLDMSSEEAAEMNRSLVRGPCRVYPAAWFKKIHFDPTGYGTGGGNSLEVAERTAREMALNRARVTRCGKPLSSVEMAVNIWRICEVSCRTCLDRRIPGA